MATSEHTASASAAPLWETDPRELLRYSETTQLINAAPASLPGVSSTEVNAGQYLFDVLEELAEQQERCYARAVSGQHRSVLVVLQGPDTAGKGELVRALASALHPHGFRPHRFGEPAGLETSRHYLWRYKQALPASGTVAVFQRSYYAELLRGSVENALEPEEVTKRYGEIGRFEKRLVESGTSVIKVALTLSREEQVRRLMQRVEDPQSQWKYHADQVPTAASWDSYDVAYEEMFAQTSTAAAPWYVVSADEPWYAHAALTELLVRTFTGMQLEWPSVRWRPQVQQRRLTELAPEALTPKDHGVQEQGPVDRGPAEDPPTGAAQTPAEAQAGTAPQDSEPGLRSAKSEAKDEDVTPPKDEVTGGKADVTGGKAGKAKKPKDGTKSEKPKDEKDKKKSKKGKKSKGEKPKDKKPENEKKSKKSKKSKKDKKDKKSKKSKN